MLVGVRMRWPFWTIPGRAILGRRTLTTGGATALAIERFMLKFDPKLMPRKMMARTGWSIPLLGFGCDSAGGTLPATRQDIFYAAAMKKGCNVFEIDGGA